MKKLIFFISLLIISSGNLLSQSGWFWQNPYPVGSHLEDCFFVNDLTGFAVGWDGVILKTTDSGKHWYQQYSKVNSFLFSLFFINANTGFVISEEDSFGFNNELLKTTDSGLNWNKIYTFNNSNLKNINFINNTTGFIVGGKYWWGGYIFKTTNEGANWEQYPIMQTNFLNSIYFVNDSTGYISGETGYLLKTTNIGLNWYYLNTPTHSPHFNAIYFLNNFTGFIAGTAGYFFKTTNEGINWQQINLNVTEDLWDINFKDENTGFISVGGTYDESAARIVMTTNSGNNWNVIPTGTPYNLRGLVARDSFILSVGNWGAIIRSSNNGFNWIEVNSGQSSSSYNDVAFINSNTGFITGTGGSFLKTIDGGSRWDSISVNSSNDLNKISFVNENTGFLIGTYGTLLKSTNSGLNWFSINLNTNYILNDLKFINQTTGFLISYYTVYNGPFPPSYLGKIFKTTNLGVNWNEELSTYYHLYSCYFLNENLGVLSSRTISESRIYRTTNGGVNWLITDAPANSNIVSFEFINVLTGFAVGNIAGTYNYSCLKTTNSGLNWLNITIPSAYNFQIKKIKFLDQYTGYFTSISFPDYGRAGDIFKTVDGGNSWFHNSSYPTFPSLQRRGLNSITFINNNIGFAVGEKRTILKTFDGGTLLAINQNQSLAYKNFKLSQNFPNPFNPITKIRFEIPDLVVNGRDHSVKLIIYDLLGRKITTLVNEHLQPGSYSVDWDASGYASGVYFYSLITNEFTETKRMVLIK